jgi:poly(3-hydroxybutyrate) depolymerase
MQKAMWFTPASSEKKPLLVGLHTWSSNFASAGGDAVYAEWAIAQGWAFVHPDFRGPNWTPQALGSDRAVQDVVEAVEWAKKQTSVDETRIYLIGVSGGGHMAMLMAGQASRDLGWSQRLVRHRRCGAVACGAHEEWQERQVCRKHRRGARQGAGEG